MKLKRTCAVIAAASLLFGLGAAQAQASPNGTNSPGYLVGNQVDGWAPVVLDDTCGPGAKHAVVSLSPATSVKPITGDEGSIQGDALRFQKSLGQDGSWSVLVSATGVVKVDVSCVLAYNYSTKTESYDFEVDTTKPTTEGTFVTASAVGGQFAPGAEVMVEASGFGENVSLTVTMYSTPVVLGSFEADATGKASATVRIPENATEGLHHLVVSSQYTTAAYAIKVVKPATAPGQGGEQAKPMKPGAQPMKPAKPQLARMKGKRPGLPSTGA
ncbi:MAG: hypothetical protein Q4D96_08125 [Propionibacteriaceae bacterium]|nr:hypothetical protein [Propionibacteriaceae bacterium]